MTKPGVLILSSVLLAGCSLVAPDMATARPLATSPIASVSPNLASVAPVSKLSLQVLQNAEYRSPDWGDYTLAQGIFRRTPLSSGESATYQTRIVEPVFYGDLNGDGLEDAAVVLATQNGGTGVFVELAAVLNRESGPQNVSTIALGDRVVVESGRIEAGVIVLEMRVQGQTDPMCCPSQFETWKFRLRGDLLARIP